MVESAALESAGHLYDHDERSGRRLGHNQAADHLAGCQPAVDLHRALRHVGQHGIRAPEGHNGGTGEEQRLDREDAVSPGQRHRRADRQSPGEEADAQDPQRVGAARPLVVQRIAGDQRGGGGPGVRSAVPLGGTHGAWEPAAKHPVSSDLLDCAESVECQIRGT